MSWRSLRLALGGLAVAGLAACADDAVVDLRLQAVADPGEARAYRELIAAFSAVRPDIRVRLEPVGRHPEHVTRLATAYAGGRPPDLFLINYRRWGQFLGSDVLEPLGPLLRETGAFDPADFYAAPLEAFSWQGELLCMPQNLSSLVVYWNRTLFRRFDVPPPTADWTWREFHDAAAQLTQDTDGDLKKDIFGLDFDPSLVRLAPFVWQTGGKLVDDIARPRRFALRDTDGIVALVFLKGLKLRRGVMPPVAQRRAQGPDARFLRGGLGMTLNSRRFTAALRQVPGLDWDVAPLPRYAQAATVLHADAYCLSRASRHKVAARDFVAFATSARGQEILSASGRIVPARQAVAGSPAFLDPRRPPESAQVFLDAAEHMRRLPNVPFWYELETRVNPVIEEWMFEPLPANASSENAVADVQRVLRLMDAASASLFAAAAAGD